MSIARRAPLRADPEAVRSWVTRSRRPLERRPFSPSGPRALPARSAARAEEKPARDALVAEVLSADWLCVAGIVGLCTRYSSDVHEIVRRSQWRAGYLVRSNCEGLCRPCHTHITAHPGPSGWAVRHGHQIMGASRDDPLVAKFARWARQATRGQCGPACPLDHRGH